MNLRTLAPGLLLAAPRLGDPNFERSVVLLGRHSDEGALGWVLNGRMLPPVRDLLRETELARKLVLPETQSFSRPARVGGPVSRGTGWILFRREAERRVPGELILSEQFAITGDATAFEGILHGEYPQDFQLLLGYAGWGPSQLEGEMQAGAWLPAPLNAASFFEGSTEKLWDEAYQRTVGSGPGVFLSGKRGSA